MENSCSDAMSQRLLTEGRLEAESRCRKSLGSTHGRDHRPKPTETPYAEDGTYGVVGGRGLATPSYPILVVFTILVQDISDIVIFLEKTFSPGIPV